MTMRLRSDPEPPHHLRPECPIALSNIVLKAMARNPELRYQAAREMFEDLSSLAHSTGGAAVAPPSYLGTSGVHGAPNPTASGVHPTITNPAAQHERSQPRRGGFDEAPAASGFMGYMGAGLGGGDPVRTNPSTTGGSTEFGSATYGTGEFMSQNYDNGFGYEQPQMESVLINSRVSEWSRNLPKYQDETPPSVAISQSHLSTERIRELAWDTPAGSVGGDGSGTISTIFHWLLVFFLGFGVGWFLFRQLKPELFGDPAVEESAPMSESDGR